MFEDAIMHVMDEGWFDMASLVAIARCSNQLNAFVDRADHLWAPFLAEIKFPQAGFVDDTKWKSSDIPPGEIVICGHLRIPPRINGGRRDDDVFFVHPRDKQARGRGLVLEASRFCSRFDQTTGILKDCFHHAENDEERSVWIPRALPIECKACRVMLDSYPALVAHCKEWSHRQNVDEACGRRVPEEFVDPRNTQPYHDHLSVFQKVMALKTFEHKFIAFHHATTIDQDGIDIWISHRQSVLNVPSVDPFARYVNPEYLLSIATLEKVREACIALVIDDFYHDRFDNCSLDVILGGWRAFELYEGTFRANRLYSSIIAGI
jgi:hypothetical protein